MGDSITNARHMTNKAIDLWDLYLMLGRQHSEAALNFKKGMLESLKDLRKIVKAVEKLEQKDGKKKRTE